MSKPPSDYDTARVRIEKLLGEMQVENLCACCCARALLAAGADLLEQAVDTGEAITELDKLSDGMQAAAEAAGERGRQLN
jgi:hypothetical protein